MTNFPAADSQAELDALPLITKFSNRENLPYEPENTLDKRESLRLAAEISAAGGFLTEAAAYREKLREISPGDTANKIELARLYTSVKTADESAKILLEILADKRADRKSRWQSLIVLAETVGNDENFWQKILSENQALEQQDSEIWLALRAVSQSQTGRNVEAVNLLQANDFTVQLKFLKAVIEKNSGLAERALADFTEISETSGEIDETFGFYESAPVFQVINLYLDSGKLRAALDLAKKRAVLKALEKNDSRPNPDFKLKTLAIRARERKQTEARTMLEKLSAAAESTGEFSDAVAFEQAKSGFLNSPDEVKNSALRIEALQQKLAEKTAGRSNIFIVTEQTVSDF